MYGLSREASAVRKDSNNLCRGVNRGQAFQGEVSSRVLSQMTNIVFKNSSLMSEEKLSIQDDKAYHDNREEATMSIMQSYNEIRCAHNRRMPFGTYRGVKGTYNESKSEN